MGMAEGIRPVPICLVKNDVEASIEQFFQRDILSRNQLTYADALKEIVGKSSCMASYRDRMRQWNNPELIHNIPKKEERIMNQKIYLSEDWLLTRTFRRGMTAIEYPGRDPATARPNLSYLCTDPFHHFDESLPDGHGYRRHLYYSDRMAGQADPAYLRRAGRDSTGFISTAGSGEQFRGLHRLYCRSLRHMNYGQDNVLWCPLDSRDLNVLLPGCVIDYMTYGASTGMYLK